MPRVSIKINILTNFAVLILIIVSLLLSLQYYSNYQLATNSVDKHFQQVSKSIIDFIKGSEKKTKNLLELLALNPEMKSKLTTDTHPALKYFIPILQNRPNAKSIYLGFANDDFYKLINLNNNNNLRRKYKLTEKSIWAVLKTINKQKSIVFLDKNLKKQLTVSEISAFKPTSRIWYIQALKFDKTITTKTYQFISTKEYGVSFAKKIPNTKTVISIDISHKNLNIFLKSKNFDKDSNIILYPNSGYAIASSLDNPPYSWENLLAFLKLSNQGLLHDYIFDKKEYFSYHALLNKKDEKGLSIAIVVPQDNLLKPYTDKIINSLYLALFFVLLSIPLVIYSTSSIVKPIKKLMEENEKIIQRKFSEVRHIHTNISELKDLSSSFVSMSQSIEEYQRAQKELLNSVVKLIAEAIDAKSVYTGGHCNRVPEIAEMLLRVVSDSKEGTFKDFAFTTEDEWEEFYIGAWLHDCGKVTSPEHVIDKSSKLETIYNRIHEIRMRFEVLHRDAQITYLESKLKGEDKKAMQKILITTEEKLQADFHFIATSNIGGEFMDPAKQERIKEIASQQWTRNFDDRLGLSDAELLNYEDSSPTQTPSIEKLLSDKKEHLVKRENFDYTKYKEDGFTTEVPEYLYNYGEVYNLCISKGTLSNEERFKINEHIIMSIKMLEQLPFPKHLKNIPEYAGTHHETLIGTGYPRGLTKDELSVPARVMAIADIFEALTASDRPYKKAKTLSQSIKIMSFMVKDQHIDADLFKIFLESGVYLDYSKKYLQIEQIDSIDIKKYLS